jgi:hypothetical protein
MHGSTESGAGRHTPLQQGIASLQAVPVPTPAQVWTLPQVPLVAPSGTLQTAPEQQSGSAVHVPPAMTQAETHVSASPSQAPEQHWPFEAQVPPFGMQLTHLFWKHSRVQQSVLVVHAAPVAAHAVVSTAQWKRPGEYSWQLSGAQQVVSSLPAQLVPSGLHVVTAVQCRTPPASGTQGAPLQHWSRNWQTLTVPRWSGSAAAMQQAGLLAS